MSLNINYYQFQPVEFRAANNQRILTIDPEAAEDVDTSMLGTDFMFYIAFFGKTYYILLISKHFV